LPNHEFKIGTVFKWSNFEDTRLGGEIKPRWFVYIGHTDYFTSPRLCFISTTTTQIEAFEKGGNRHSHKYIKIEASKTCFESDCILDFEEPPYTKELSSITTNPNIEIKGQLDTSTMKIIYNGICNSPNFSKKLLNDIHEAFNMARIEGLRKPK